VEDENFLWKALENAEQNQFAAALLAMRIQQGARVASSWPPSDLLFIASRQQVTTIISSKDTISSENRLRPTMHTFASLLLFSVIQRF
jgi:hypothetical protein